LFSAYQGSVVASRLFNTRTRVTEVTGWLKAK